MPQETQHGKFELQVAAIFQLAIGALIFMRFSAAQKTSDDSHFFPEFLLALDQSQTDEPQKARANKRI